MRVLPMTPRVPPFFADAFGKLSHAGLLRAYSLSCEERFIGGYVGFLHADRTAIIISAGSIRHSRWRSPRHGC